MEQYLLQMKQSFISVRNIKWKFNIDAAPWRGRNKGTTRSFGQTLCKKGY